MLHNNTKIPILLYHKIHSSSVSNIDEVYSISYTTFESHIKYLYKNNFTPVLLNSIKRDIFSNNSNIIAITFDDGHSSDYYIAYKILKEYHFPATFFITTGWIGKKGYLSWDHIQEMQKGGMSIQSHSVTHSFLNTLDTTKLYYELNHSKFTIENKLNSKCNLISIPGGFVSKKVIKAAFESGYTYIYTSKPKLANPLNSHVFGRFVITSKTSFDQFVALVNKKPIYLEYKYITYIIKSFIKKILGPENYHYIWSKYFKYNERKK